MEFFTKKHRGFTLIELLVVIAIIGILASIVLVSLGGARSKARDAARQSDMRQIALAMEMNYDDNSFAYLQAAAMPSAIGTAMLDVPEDPQGGVYGWIDNTAVAPGCDDSQRFCTYAELENAGSCVAPDPVRYFAASHKGTKEICDADPPVNFDCDCW